MYRNMRQLFAAIALAAGVQSLDAGDATWKQNPVSNDWNTAQNWTPETIPNTEADTATFGRSTIVDVSIGEWSDGSGNTVTRVGELVFAEGASAYTITVTPVVDALYPS